MKLKKILVAIATIIAMTSNIAYASILGEIKESSFLEIGNGLHLYKSTFLSQQQGVGKQTEYYGKYTPNDKVVPVVVTGEAIYGKRNAKEIVEYMKNNKLTPMLGINASFFSFQTGIPMGHVISDGVVTSKDNRILPGIGFRADSTAFIEDMYIQTTMNFGEDYVLEVPHINKYISKETQMLTLFTPEFGENTGTSTKTLNVVLTNITDKIKIGTEISCTVKEIFENDKPVKINDDEFVLSVNTEGNQWAITLIGTMYEGQEIKITTTANSDSWNGATSGLASDGERLISSGEIVKGLAAGTAPRTAVGITDTGEIIFYVIDGRQPGYSYGVKKETLANRLAELGCVEALNLDGGGSTTMTGVYPGSDVSSIINVPSEGAPRDVTNFIFLKNVTSPVGKTNKAYIYPYSKNILSGTTIALDVKTVDENYYPTEHGEVVFEGNEYVDIKENGKITALGEGVMEVTANVDGVSGTATYNSYITPHDILLYNTGNGKEIKAIEALPNETINLNAKAYYNETELLSSNDAYRWTTDSDDIVVDQNGVLKVSEYANGEYMLSVKAGAFGKDFVVNVDNPNINDELYPYSQINVDKNTLTVDFYSDSEPINMEKSYIRINGENVSLDNFKVTQISSKHIRAVYDYEKSFDEGYHNIYCQTVLDNGYANINTLKIKKDAYKSVFSDTQGHWAEDIISYMNNMKVVNGSYENSKLVYRPQDTVTRAEFAVMACNFLGLKTEEYKDVSLDGFYDKDIIPLWAKDYVKAVYSNGIINGKDNNGHTFFDASANITRAEALTIISRILPQNLKKDIVSYNDKIDIPDWAQNAVEVLSAADLISGYEDNTIRPKNSVTRAEAITMLYNIF